MNKRKLYTIILAVVVMIGVVASQVGSVGAECIRNCPSPMMIAPILPPGE